MRTRVRARGEVAPVRLPALDLDPSAWVWPVGLVLLAGVAAVAAAWVDWRLAAPVGLGIPLVAWAILDNQLAKPAPARSWPWIHSPIALAWIWTLLFFGAEMTIFVGPRDTAAAGAGQISVDNLVEMLTYGPPTLVVMSALRDGWPGRVPKLAQMWVFYGVWTVMTVAWSQQPILSAGRALQIVVLAAFVAYCASRARAEPDFVEKLLVPLLRLITFGVLLFALWGIADGYLSQPRFGWRGTHALTAAPVMSIPVLALLFHPERARITRPIPWWAVVLLLSFLIYSTGSRVAMAASVVALAAGWGLAALRDGRIAGVGVGIALILTGLATGVLQEAVVEWFRRGESTEKIMGLNGRMELWGHILDNPMGSEVWGIGVGAARGPWPISWTQSHAHSAWIDVLISTGVIGAALLGTVVLGLLALAGIRRNVTAGWMATIAAANSWNSVTISWTGQLTMLLAIAMFVVWKSDQPPEPGRAKRGVRPV